MSTAPPHPSQAVTGPPIPIGGSYLGLLRKNHDFRRFFVAVVISLIGDWFLVVALLDLVLELTGKASLATLVVVAFNLPVFLVSPWAGTQADPLHQVGMRGQKSGFRIGFYFFIE